MGVSTNTLGLTNKELVTRAISISGNRNPYFMDLLDQYKKRYPGAKIVYANNTTGAVVGSEPTPDFILIMKVMSVSPDPRLPDKPLIFIEAPLIFGERSIAGWTLAVEHGKIEEYFDSVWQFAPRLEERRFYEYLESIFLNTNKDSPLYWKSSNNTKMLVKGIMELSSMYIPKSEMNKMRASAIKANAEKKRKEAIDTMSK